MALLSHDFQRRKSIFQKKVSSYYICSHLNMYSISWINSSILGESKLQQTVSRSRKNVHQVLKGATMRHWWKLLSFKFRSIPSQAASSIGKKTTKGCVSTHISTEIRPDAFQAMAGSGSGSMRTTTSYRVISRSSGITHRGDWAGRVVALSQEKHSKMGSCSESVIPPAREGCIIEYVLWL